MKRIDFSKAVVTSLVQLQMGYPKQSSVHAKALKENALKPALARFLPQLRLNLFLIIFGLLFWVHPVLAQNSFPRAIEIKADFTETQIGQNLWILEDPTGQWSFDQMRTPEIAVKFKPSSTDNPNFGYTSSVYWAHLQLQHNGLSQNAVSQTPLYLKLAFPSTDLAELLCIDASGTAVVKQRSGDHVPLAEWPTT